MLVTWKDVLDVEHKRTVNAFRNCTFVLCGCCIVNVGGYQSWLKWNDRFYGYACELCGCYVIVVGLTSYVFVSNVIWLWSIKKENAVKILANLETEIRCWSQFETEIKFWSQRSTMVEVSLCLRPILFGLNLRPKLPGCNLRLCKFWSQVDTEIVGL